MPLTIPTSRVGFVARTKSNGEIATVRSVAEHINGGHRLSAKNVRKSFACHYATGNHRGRGVLPKDEPDNCGGHRRPREQCQSHNTALAVDCNRNSVRAVDRCTDECLGETQSSAETSRVFIQATPI
jgi:hypothetical protein